MHSSKSVARFQHFIGVDVGKEMLVACHHASRQLASFANSKSGITEFLSAHADWLENAYFVVDTTGGWERPLIAALLDKGVTVHRADGRRVKSFARSLGKLAKTDAIDAAILARYGHDRQAGLAVCQLGDDAWCLLKALVARRTQLATMAKEEKQRLSAPVPDAISILIEENLENLQGQLMRIECAIVSCINDNAPLRQKYDLMQTMPGIGPLTAAFLLAEMPELGQLDRKQIASIAGLAPHAYDSGKMNGRRTTYGGRPNVKNILFLAALNAARAKDNTIRTFYERLIAAGKSKRCAIIASARKLITILNARLYEKFFHNAENMSR